MLQGSQKIIYLVHLVSKKIIYISSNVEKIFGLRPAKFYLDGFGVFRSICQEDEEFVLFSESRMPDAGKSGLYSGHILLRCTDNRYRSFEHNAIVIETDTHDAPTVLVGSLFYKVNDLRLHFGCSSHLRAKNEWTEHPPSGIASLTSLKNMVKKMPLKKKNGSEKLQLLFDNTLSTALSNRQKQVIKYLAKGYSAKRIANKMAISESTVIDHKKKLLVLFHAKNTVEMVAKASKLFWI